jgi:hypothetical protein
MTRKLTKKEFEELCKTHDSIFSGDECNSLGHYWEIYTFEDMDVEYHKRVKLSCKL